MSIERSQNAVDSEKAEESRAQAGSPVESGNVSFSTKSQKKKRRDQKSLNVFDMFSEHIDIGNWADAASESFPSTQKTDTVDAKPIAEETHETLSANAQTVSGDVPIHGGPASHSRCGAPYEEQSLQLFVSNIPWAARSEDLFYFFGGEGAVAHVQLSQGSRPEWNNGTAVITFHTLEAFLNGRGFDHKEFAGRQLKIREQRRQPYAYKENYGYNDRRFNNMDGYPPRPGGGYGTHQYFEERTFPRAPRKNASYAGVPTSFTQNDYYLDSRRLQPNNQSFRHIHSAQNAHPNYRGRNSYGGAPLKKSPSEEGGIRGYVRKGSFANDGQKPMLPMQQPLFEPSQRRKLELAPRTIPIGESQAEPRRSSSIFGDAKPVDTSKREREVEERLEREDRVARTSRSRKTSSEVCPSHSTTPTLPPVIVPVAKPVHTVENQIMAPSIPPVEEEKSVEDSASKPILPPAEVSSREDLVLTTLTGPGPNRKTSTGAPVLIHSQSLPPLPKAQSKESVHDTSGAGSSSKTSGTIIFTNSSFKSKTYGGRRSDRGRERSHYNSAHHDNAVKRAPERFQQNYSDSATQNERMRRGSSGGKEKPAFLGKERRNGVLSETVVDVTPVTNNSETTLAEDLGKVKEASTKEPAVVKEEGTKGKKEKVAAGKEKKKANSAKTMPKLNTKPSVVAITNKFAALLETNE